MWIYVCPNLQMNINSRNGRKRNFSSETKASIHLSQRGEWSCGAQSIKESRLLCESMFIQIDRQIVILKMVEKEAFLMKPRHQHNFSQLGNYVYDSSSLKEKRSVFVQIDKWTLNMKWWKEKFFL